MKMPPQVAATAFLPRTLFRNPNSLARYGSAAVVTALAAVLTYAMWSSLGSTISPLFFIGVLVVSWYGGLRPGLMASILSAAACSLIFTKHPAPVALGVDDLLRLATFMIGTLFVSSLMMGRRQAEEAALNAKKQLTITLKSIGDAVITTDARGRITFMNQIAQSLTGWRPDEANGREIDELFRIVDGETGAEVETVVTRVLRDNVVVGVGGPVFMVTRDGSTMPVDQIATPMRDHLGQINGIVLVLRSIPALKAKDPERELTETIALLDAVDASLLAVDLNGCCAFASKSAAQLLGYQPYELAGKHIGELLLSGNEGDWTYSAQRSAGAVTVKSDAGALMTTETLSRRDAGQVPVELCRAPLIVGEQIVGTVITITDLTERRRAQEAITRLESITNSVDEAIITHTSDGIITSWNRAAERIYGYLEEEVIGRHISIVHPPGFRQELQALFDRVVQKERVDPFETVRVKKGGENIFVSISAVPLNEGIGSVSVVQIVSDLTQRKKAEEVAQRTSGEYAATPGRARVPAASPRANKPGLPIGRKAIDQTVPGQKANSEPAGSAIIVGRSPVMKKLFATIERVAPSDSSILITGATGTGKELVARAIHEKSRRAHGPFVDVNCSAIPETLIEAELFGHQRGTFTGAHENRAGLFEAASGGTIFLDEVDALPLAAQAKLLRVLQERCVRRVGGRTNIAVDVRIISATNCDLSAAISEGRFRSDLFYRLRVFPIHSPQLCDRQDDVELLIDYLLDRHADQHGLARQRFTPEAMTGLLRYAWPGNVRELQSAVEYALAIGQREELGIEDLPPEFSRQCQQTSDLKQLLEGYRNDGVPLADIEKHYILSVLRQFDGNQVRAAAALGIDRSKLYRRLKQYGIKAVKFLQEEQRDGLQLLSSRKNESDDSIGDGEVRLRRSAASIG